MVQKSHIYVLALAGLMANSQAVYAEFYKWVDSDGNVHYTQKPPAEEVQQVETIKPRTSPASAEAINKIEQNKEKLQGFKEQRAEDKEKAEKTAKVEAAKKKNCEIAKGRLATYSRPRGLIQQDDGTAVRIAEEKRQEEIKKANDMIKEWCR